jgi:hypothetical protein
MYKENFTKEQLNKMKFETIEEAMKRGVEIEVIPEGKSGLKKNQPKQCPVIDASKLPAEFRDLVK